MGVLDGIRIVEVASSPATSVCGMMLADLGADVILIDPPGKDGAGPRPTEIYNRGKRSIVLDLNQHDCVQTLLQLVQQSDIVLEGGGPGLAEVLGYGPDICLAKKPSLVFGRSSGFGQNGPAAMNASSGGISTAVSGALWMETAPDETPLPRADLLGVVGGGALYLAIGVLAALLRAREDGGGQVVDSSMLEGSAHMFNLLVVMLEERGSFDMLRPDAFGCYALRSYQCADGEWINLSAIEPRFHTLLLERLGLADDAEFCAGLQDREKWPVLAKRFEQLFANRPRDEWCGLLSGDDTCFAPILAPEEAARHPHGLARHLYDVVDGVLQVSAAPRFSATPSAPTARVPRRDEHRSEILATLPRSKE
ncbi:CoA transferase [Pokkaliibacter plantistimulans]|uniref:CoA transferase n=1 Tax=Proteobacteria bacterium 228 TaxID=2083153 RepID=A0A2S5KHG9_9PROT|nr:CaiB/BaiF CoA-transferase family protein [Pokkaliibacter plantistimulans]PPC74212.1 CoA transferase [Pokkaliibacter plantistimulans]